MKAYTIMKNGKYVRDYSEGKRFTSDFRLAEKYITKKAAEVAARAYGKSCGAGYHVV